MRDDRRQSQRETQQTKAAWQSQQEQANIAKELARLKKEEDLRASLKKSKAPRVNGEWLDAIFKVAPRLEMRDYVTVLSGLQNKPHVRPISTWEPKGKGRETVFRSLCSHLFAPYQMPPFLWSIFFEADREALIPFILNVARGASIPDQIKKGVFSVPLTRKMCHELMQTTSEFTFTKAVRRAQIRGLGGSERFFNVWTQTRPGARISDDPEVEAFWATVIDWFIKFPMLDLTQVSPMADYINHRWFADKTFSMKGRTPLALLRDTTEWHTTLTKTRVNRVIEFKPSGFQPFCVEKQGVDFTKKPTYEFWRVEELLSNKALADEGRTLNHCVYSYGYSVERGGVSIWSMTLNGEKTLTMEVNNYSRKVVQVRGKHNRMAAPGHEVEVLNQWANLNNLGVSLGRW